MDYWSKRKIELDKSLEKDEELLKKRLSAYYDKEQTKLEKEIASFYARYGDNNILAYRNLLVSMEPEDVALLMERMDEFFVKYPDYAKLMPVRKYIYKLNRLEGLQYSIYLQQQEIGAVTNKELTVHLAKQAEKYGKAAATAIGHGTIFNAVNKSVAETFLITDWAAGKNYSQRIWENANKLAQYLNTDFAQGIARGDSYQKLITNLKDRFANVTRRDAFRLVYTEGTYVMNEASIRVFEEQYDEYEFSPINDEKTCSVCSSLKGQRFLISDRQAGVNFPPMHPYCRCSFVVVHNEKYNQMAANSYSEEMLEYKENAEYHINVQGKSYEVNQGLSKACKEVAKLGYNDNKEHLSLVNLDTGEIEYTETGGSNFVGGSGFWNHLINNKTHRYAFVHNHNNKSGFSIQDIETLSSDNNIDIFIISRYDGTIETVESNGKKLLSLNYLSFYENDLKSLQTDLKNGKITTGEYVLKKKKIIVSNLIRDYTKGVNKFE